MDNELAEAIAKLRAHCNAEISYINRGRGRATPGFHRINAFLRQCDDVFRALDKGPLRPSDGA